MNANNANKREFTEIEIEIEIDCILSIYKNIK